MGHSLSPTIKKDRIDKIREAIKDSGKDYHNSCKIRIFDSNLIANWTNEFLPAILYVQKCNRQNRPLGLITWNDWSKKKEFSIFPYHENTNLKEKRFKILKNCIDKKITRIIGLSGLGKSRLVFETFNINNETSISEIQIKSLSDSLVYFDCSTSNGDSLKQYLNSHFSSFFAHIVVDNCSSELHKNLQDIIERRDSKFTLTTIDHSLEVSYLPGLDFVKLDNQIYKDLIPKILKEYFSGKLNDEDIAQISEYTEGFIQMATLFANARLENQPIPIGHILDTPTVKKLIAGREVLNPKEYEIIKVCSIFTSFILPVENAHELYREEKFQELQKETKFIQENLCDNVSYKFFRNTCKKFHTRGLMERRGNYLMVKPTPLAVKLALEWWESIPPEEITKLFELLIKHNLAGRIADRLNQLGNLSYAKSIVEKLWGENRPFSKAEVLNSPMGSRLFCSIVEVNPEATVKAIASVFLPLTLTELKSQTQDRRYLVWALGKLCFRKSSFELATKILLNFAAAETETFIGNNSTALFLQLFQVYLPGTESSFDERIQILELALSKNSKVYNQLIIKACSKGLDCGTFNRIGGSERQGLDKPLQDYRPKNQKEVISYIEKLIGLLKSLVEDSEVSDSAIEVIIGHIRCLFKWGYDNSKISELINILSKKNNFPWLKVLNNLRITQQYEKHLSEPQKNTIESLIKLYQPKNLDQKIYSTVSNADWGIRLNQNDINKRLKELAAELIEIKNWREKYLSKLLKNRQIQGIKFGEQVAKIATDQKETLDSIVNFLSKENIEQKNISFLIGYLQGVQSEELVKYVFEKVISIPNLNIFAFEIIKLFKATVQDIDLLFECVRKKTVDIKIFTTLQWGNTLNILSWNEIQSICEKLVNFGDKGIWIGLGFIEHYTFEDEENWKNLKGYLKKLISENNFLTMTPIIENYDIRNWEKLVITMLKNEKEKSLSKVLSLQIIEACKNSISDIGYTVESTSRVIIEILFDKYFNQIWEHFGNAFLSENFILHFNIKNIIAEKAILTPSSNILFKFEKNYPIIIKWCENNKPLAPARLIEISPLWGNDKDLLWHPLTKEIIDNYGNDEMVLRKLSGNLGTFGSVGSTIPIYESRKKLCEKLINHPEEKVRNWAKMMIHKYDGKIKRALIREEERYGN